MKVVIAGTKSTYANCKSALHRIGEVMYVVTVNGKGKRKERNVM
jgi:hypothetical protein